MEIDKIYLGDCLELIKEIPDKSIDLVLTDPPYRVTPKGSYGTMSGYWTEDRTNKGKIFAHNDIDIKDYIGELYRVLKADSHCYIMCNNVNLPHFFDAISKSDFHFVKLLVWDKQTKICGRYYMGQMEFIFFLRKGKDKPINDCGTSDLLSYPNRREKGLDGKNIHDSQKPTRLFQCLIENSTDKGQLVFDPFIGSGTTALAAIASKRHFIGMELNKEYYDIACKRVKNELSNPTLF